MSTKDNITNNEKVQESPDTMSYINIRKDDRFASVTMRSDAPSDFEFDKSILITLRMLYENQKKILNNQKAIWVAINNFSPDEILKPDMQRALRRVANGLMDAADDMYR